MLCTAAMYHVNALIIQLHSREDLRTQTCNNFILSFNTAHVNKDNI